MFHIILRQVSKIQNRDNSPPLSQNKHTHTRIQFVASPETGSTDEINSNFQHRSYLFTYV